MSSDYVATIVRLPETNELAGCDNVRGAMFFGLQAIVSKDDVPGTLGVLFPTEVRLSDEYLRENNLFRDPTKNKDPEKKGYFEENGRVRAQKFRGHRSDAFWMPINSLDYADPYQPIEVSDDVHVDLKEGWTFNELNGHLICQKYIPKGTKVPGQQMAKTERRVSEKFFPQHEDTSNFFRNIHKIAEDAQLVVTQKLHGTSVRVGKVPVRQKLSWFARLAKKLGVPVQETAYELVAGSRRVIKDQQAGDGGFYSEDIYTATAQSLESAIPDGFMVYGELIGWTPSGQAIQSGYTYQIPKGLSEFYVYRVTTMSPQGIQTDLSWQAVREFCSERGFKHVPEMTRVDLRRELLDLEDIQEGIEETLDKSFAASYEFFDATDEMVPLEPDNPCDEGVVIRVEGLRPEFYKAKSPLFLQHETKQLDKGEVDIETQESLESV